MMTETIVVNIRDYDHLTHPGSYVVIDRTTKWGNPFLLSNLRADGNRVDVINQYRDWIQTQPALLAALPELRGKVLVCWCAPLPCHGHVLKELADATD